MTRNAYLTRLAELLQDIPAEERVAAMEYYKIILMMLAARMSSR